MPTLSRTINSKQESKNTFYGLMFKVSSLKLKPGFTLIELLIVLTLIGILSGIVASTYTSSQKKGRDAKRKSDLQQIKKALELAKSDCKAGSYYPRTSFAGGEGAFINLSKFYLSNPNQALNLGFIPAYIQDPQYAPGATYYGYFGDQVIGNVCVSISNKAPNSSSGVKVYVLRAKLEITNDPDSQKTFLQCQSKINMVNWPGAPDDLPTDGNGYYYVCSD